MGNSPILKGISSSTIRSANVKKMANKRKNNIKVADLNVKIASNEYIDSVRIPAYTYAL